MQLLELYDLERDPGETKNLAESQPQLVRYGRREGISIMMGGSQPPQTAK